MADLVTNRFNFTTWTAKETAFAVVIHIHLATCTNNTVLAASSNEELNTAQAKPVKASYSQHVYTLAEQAQIEEAVCQPAGK